MAYTTQNAFYHPSHAAVYDPRLRNWSTWGHDSQTASDREDIDSPAPLGQNDLFPDADGPKNASFAPPSAPGSFVSKRSDNQEMLWASPANMPTSHADNGPYAQPIQHWPSDVIQQYSEIAANPTTFSLPLHHRGQAAYTPAHKMAKGVHIDSSISHGQPPIAIGPHGQPPLAIGPPALLPPPGASGALDIQLVAGMESLALVPFMPPPPRPPVEPYHNNINPIPRPPSAPPALQAPVDDALYMPPIAITGPPPAPVQMHYAPAPAAMPPLPPALFDTSYYMQHPPAPAPAPQPPVTAFRSYMAATNIGNHINPSQASPVAPAPTIPEPPMLSHAYADAPGPPPMIPPKKFVDESPMYDRPSLGHYPSHSSSSGSAKSADKPLKGILQRTPYEEPPAATWASLWNEAGPYPVVPPPVAPHERRTRTVKSIPRSRGNSVSAFPAPSSQQHAYSAAPHIHAQKPSKHGRSNSGSHMVSPQDQLDALLSGSAYNPTHPTGTHPFFNGAYATPVSKPVAPAMGNGGYPWYPANVQPPSHADMPSTQLNMTYVSGLFNEDYGTLPTAKAPKGGKEKPNTASDKENQLFRSNTVAYGTTPKMANGAPMPTSKDSKRRSIPAPQAAEALWGMPMNGEPPHAATSWYTSSVMHPETHPQTTGKIKKVKHAQPPVQQTPAPITPTSILQKPNETAPFYGHAVKFADDPIVNKR
ncbi:hypothetical protein BKA62DRAFT_667978 [Auriculariales sp. MPI-PUGE-AT-0066]|nr:hypothetical protein BKA62DRAFT_667978 [Auriculariales sp. MPI-PUGE-AT-0066]